jgi:hypothetical protein
MKHLWIVAVLLCLGLAMGAWASPAILEFEFGALNARSLGMGFAGVGLADDAAAWYQNPAGLACLNVPVTEGAGWASDVQGSFADMFSTNFYALNYAGWSPASKWGVGAGGVKPQDGDTLYGAGVGYGFGNSGFSLGANFMRSSGGGSTLVNAGALFQIKQEALPAARIGLRAWDVTNQEGGPWYDLGVAWSPVKQFLVAVDAWDLTDEFGGGVTVNGGVEYKFGTSDAWKVRLGAADLDGYKLTYGLGYGMDKWRVDVGYITAEGEHILAATAGLSF